MRLVCTHADTVDALKRLGIKFDDLTPEGLWSSQYHLLGLTPDQVDALEAFQVQIEDVTPAQMAQGAAAETRSDTIGAGTAARSATQTQTAAPTQGAVAGAMAVPQAAHELAVESPVAAATSEGTRPTDEAEVPLAQGRDAGARPADARLESKSSAQGAQGPQSGAVPANSGAAASAGSQQPSGQKNAGKSGGGQNAQQNRKGQQQGGGQGGQRYGTTRLRISVAGKYTEATVANGKIVVAGRTFDSPDQAAAELTKSRGDWTFWEYYDSTDGKWRMLTRDWDSVLKSAAPAGGNR